MSISSEQRERLAESRNAVSLLKSFGACEKGLAAFEREIATTGGSLPEALARERGAYIRGDRAGYGWLLAVLGMEVDPWTATGILRQRPSGQPGERVPLNDAQAKEIRASAFTVYDVMDRIAQEFKALKTRRLVAKLKKALAAKRKPTLVRKAAKRKTRTRGTRRSR